MLDLLFQTILKKNNTQAKLSPLSETRRYQDRFFLSKSLSTLTFSLYHQNPLTFFSPLFNEKW